MFRTLSAPIIRSIKNCNNSLYWIYIIPTHDTHRWLLLQFLVLLMMGAESVRNMYSVLAVVNKKTIQPKVASRWFFIYVGKM